MRYLIEYFIRFRQLIGRKVYNLLALMFVVGFVEGLGITLFLPILQNGFGEDKLSQGLKIIFNALRIGFSFNILLILIMVFFILRSVFLISYARYFGRLSAGLAIALRWKVLRGIFDADYLYTLKKETGYINNAITHEIACVVDAFNTFSRMLGNGILALIYIGISLSVNFRVTMAVILLAPIIAIFMKRINRLTNMASVGLTASQGKFHSILIQVLSKIKYLKATFSVPRVRDIINRDNESVGNLRFRLYFLQSLARDAFEPLIVFVVVALLFYQVTILGRSPSEVVFLAFLFIQVARQILNAQSSYRKFLAARGSIEIFKKLEKELFENRETLNPDGREPDFGKELKFQDVTMVFPNGKEALKNVNLNIMPKSVVALVGFSGSGKSTIANMVSAILKPTSGMITLAGEDLSKLNLKTLRESIGYVTQEDIIFNATIKDNITLWESKVDDKKLQEVIEMSYISDFVSGLPNKEETFLGDNGLDISGGQRQRITVARELYKDTKLLILDEATSSLDSKSERHIYDSLRRFKGKKTMLVIAHRLSTVKNADYIYVFDEGKVVEKGSYDELIRREGAFKRMINEQRLTENDEEKVKI